MHLEVFHIVTTPDSHLLSTPISPCMSSPIYSATVISDPSNYHVHVIQQFQVITSVASQVSDQEEWKTISLQNLGYTCYLNSVLQRLFTLNYSTTFFLQILSHH